MLIFSRLLKNECYDRIELIRFSIRTIALHILHKKDSICISNLNCLFYFLLNPLFKLLFENCNTHRIIWNTNIWRFKQFLKVDYTALHYFSPNNICTLWPIRRQWNKMAHRTSLIWIFNIIPKSPSTSRNKKLYTYQRI